MSNHSEPLAVSVAEACRLSSLGRTKIYEALKQNKLKAHKIGRRTLIRMDSLRSLITGEASP